MKLFLTSKGLVNEEVQENFYSFVEGRKKVSIITTASIEYKEKNRNNVKLQEKLKYLGFTCKFIDVEFERPEKLDDSQITVINGGNPYYLLHHIKRSGADSVLRKRLKDDTPLMGISSGLLVLMKNLGIIDRLSPEMNTINLKDKTGLNLIDEIIIPHYDRFIKEGKIKKEDVDKFEVETKNQLIRLGEYQCVKYQNGAKEIIGELMK